ncbi:MAG TPA: aminotransferase class I/II-fold pyridoxal phosphate-dependent enzyme [Polyangiales bacterium]
MSSSPSDKRRSLTPAVHSGEPARFAHDALTLPIIQTATYTFENTAELVAYMEGHKEREEYGRYGNPTVRVLEERIAALEGAEDAAVFGSGMAAVTSAILALVGQGAHVVLFNDCYRRTRQFVTSFLARFGVRHTLVGSADLSELERAIEKDTKLVISEAPTNPYLSVVDLPRLAQICKERRVKTLIDATFATPVNLTPVDLGIDLVVHSATKYLSGHNDVLCGAVAGKAGLVSLVRDVRHMMGAVCDPHAAYLVHRGLKTLGLRVAQQNATTQAMAEVLEAHPKVRRVWYPGLGSHPNHATAKSIMRGFGGVVTFDLKGDLASTGRFVDALRIPRIAASLGGVESLVEQPALMSYFELSSEAREKIGMRDTLVRYAVGIEDADDLIDDLLQALAVAGITD